MALNNQYPVTTIAKKIENPFVDENNFEKFIELLAKLAVTEKIETSQISFIIKNKSLTKTSLFLKEIHKKFFPQNKLTNHHDFFKIIRTIKQLDEKYDTNTKLRDAIQRAKINPAIKK